MASPGLKVCSSGRWVCPDLLPLQAVISGTILNLGRAKHSGPARVTSLNISELKPTAAPQPHP